MIGGAVTSQRAVATVGAGGNKFEPAIGRGRDVIAVKIDEPGLALHSVRVMAGAAGRFLVHNMKAMTAVLSLTVGGVKALIVQDAGAVMAFIAQSVFGSVLDVAVGQDELALQQRSEG